VVGVAAKSSQVGRGYAPPIVDNTSAVVSRLADGDLQSQTYTVVAEGRPSADKFPTCIGSGSDRAGANCVSLCVRIPKGSTLSKVEGFSANWARVGQPWLPCNSTRCLDQNPEQAKAMFGPSGYTQDQVPGFDRVCWIFRSWHPDFKREAVLRVTFRIPK
jgi:hypothetical protein